MSRQLYALILFSIATPQREALKEFHRVELRVCLGVHPFAGNTATLLDAQDSLLRHQAEA